MKKIPLRDSESSPVVEPVSPRFLLDALEILLLGSVWLFVLVWLPYFQTEPQSVVPQPVLRLQWITTLALAFIVIAFRWQHRQQKLDSKWEYLALALIAVFSIAALFLQASDWYNAFATPCCVAQALFGLVYFAMGRVGLK